MAVTYIKLGPIGDSFNSDELGIYLNDKNSAEIDSSLLRNRLKSFYLTGFLVEISKVEHENIKLKNINARNIPLVIVPLSATLTLEPVEAVQKIPPVGVFPGNRYLVERGATGAWEGYDDYIAQFNGSIWVFTKPLNGYILPIYNWGVSTHYTGTYPSGRWDYSDLKDLIDFGTIPGGIVTDPGADNYALQLFIVERDARIKRDDELYSLIQNITQNPQSIKAVAVSIQDANGYYESTNVELALQEIGERLKNQDKKIADLIKTIADLGNLNLEEILQRLQDLTNELQIFTDYFGESIAYLSDNVIFKDGSVDFIADQSMGGNKLTNLAKPTAANDAVRLADLLTSRVKVSRVVETSVQTNQITVDELVGTDPLLIFRSGSTTYTVDEEANDNYKTVVFDPDTGIIDFPDNLYPGEWVKALYTLKVAPIPPEPGSGNSLPAGLPFNL